MIVMRIDLWAGYFWSEAHGFGRITEMFDLDGDETLEPELVAAVTVQIDRGHYLAVPVREGDEGRMN
jgi:hypothetical protein